MDEKIEYSFIEIEIPDFKPEFFSLWIQQVVKSNNKVLENISYVFCSDEYLLKMNTDYLEHDYYTDIITFNYNEENSLSGDLFISYDRVKDNASIEGVDVFDELCRVMVHGVLHLIGFNDKSDKEQELMTIKENEYLNLRNSFT